MILDPLKGRQEGQRGEETGTQGNQRDMGRCCTSGLHDGGRGQEPRPVVPLEAGKAKE